jgi:hypothetical protein
MEKIVFISVFCLGLILPVCLQAQIPTQTIRGEVTDAASGASIPGVTVVVDGHEPVIGTVTGPDGTFRLTGVPVGRHSLRFSYIGYESLYLRDLVVTSVRETVLDVTLRESVTEMEPLFVRPEMSKHQPINTMAVSSARQLSMEEASRYAGGFDDPARLAASFAGVAGNLGDNAMVIRGNAPKGLLWQMEGVEIPTPSHFANILTLGGGGITALSSQMIADSDFYTGAFPAEYGNALSGVLDLNLRNGNNQHYEHTIKAGVIGIDLASEGPVSGNSSYLFNYRMSTFSLIAPLLPENAGNIRYHNLSYKLNFPTGPAGIFSVWGIGGSDFSGSIAEENPAEWVYDKDREAAESPTRFGAAGIRHRLLMGAEAYLTTSFVVSGNGLRWEVERFEDEGSFLYPREFVHGETGKLTVKSVLNYKISSRHTNRAGITLNRLGYNQVIRQSREPSVPLETIVNTSGHSYLYQGFTQSRIDFGAFLLTGGLHFQHIELTESNSIEPRIGVQYRTGQNTFSLSYGRHSQTEPLSVYFSHPENLNLDLTKADHFVAGFSRMVRSNLLLNLEVYYQSLRDVPVLAGSSFSVLNLELDWFLRDPLLNEGAGRNYGIELTLERYFTDGWYVLFTGSLFDSEYRGGDGVWRNTRFNRGYVTALLGGKEWELRGEGHVRVYSINARLNLMGGKRISPVDEQRTIENREVFYDETRAFSNHEPDVLYGDLTFEYRINRSSRASVWSLQVINITGYKEFYGYLYNLTSSTIDEDREMILVPNLSYKIEF